MSELGDIIASEKLFGQRPDEERFPITIEIGRPYKVGGISPTEWSCPVKVEPFSSGHESAHGEGSFHALCMALYVVQLQLVPFKERGGTLSLEDGQDFQLDGHWHSNEVVAAKMSDTGVA